MIRAEESLQLAVVDWLMLELKPPAVFWATINQRGTRKAWEQRMMAALGLRAGVPDLWVLSDGLLLGLELKAPPRALKSGKVSRATVRLGEGQKEFLPQLEAAGAKIEICRSVEEVRSALHRWSVPMRWRVR